MSTAEAEPTTTPEPVAAEAEKDRRDIFRYSDFVHVGDGAEECEHATDGECKDADHFHAWVRLPNPFQVRDIAEKARAARARRIRSLRDPESDAAAILEQELEDLRHEGLRDIIIEEVIDQDFATDYDAAQREVMDLEDPNWVPGPEDEDAEVPKLFADIIQDQEEYTRQLQLPEDQRDEDYPELQKAVTRWSEAINEALEKQQNPRREALKSQPLDELVDLVRRKRIEQSANEVHLHTFNTWQWYVCTYKPRKKGTPNERVFKDIAQFKYEAPGDVIAALQVTFRELEQAMAGDRGNS
jgi:hypothetical protein